MSLLSRSQASGERSGSEISRLCIASFLLPIQQTAPLTPKPMRQIAIFSAFPSQFTRPLEKTALLRAKASTDELLHDRRANVSISITISQRYLTTEPPLSMPQL